jgi:hypothetical protein
MICYFLRVVLPSDCFKLAKLKGFSPQSIVYNSE